jgi:MerR family transcriptional regulator, thiopeptide resistance regulator
VSWSVGELAELASVTVRTLHHYDRLGLLSPSGRTPAGHRRYEAVDLERLQRVLFYRELGFPLEEISTLLDEGADDPVAQLERQHRLLTERARRLRRMAEAVASTVRARRAGVTLTPEEMFEVFGDFDPADHAEEAEQRWGDTEEYRESRRRTSAYRPADWAQITAEARGINQRMAAAMAAGEPPDGSIATGLAEEHRRHISRWFYPCSYEIHRGLAQMYVDDPRFAKGYEEVAEGLSGYVRDAVLSNADAQA